MTVATKLKNSLLILTLMTISFLGMTSCTQPDGNIGDWFGSWHLEEILINGEPDEEYTQNRENDRMQVMVSFQGKIFNMAYINGNEIYGTWSYAGEILTLIASYNAGGGHVSPLFNPYPVVLHFPGDVEQVEITVTYINSKTMQWQLIDQNGRLLTYNFRKYPG